MKCERCKSRATVHIIDISSHGMKDFHLCSKCAKTKGYDLMPDEISFDQVLQRLINDSSELLEQGGDGLLGKSQVKCESCGITRRDIFKDSRFGCDEDFSLFRDEIREMLQIYHGATQHLGKSNTVNSDSSRKQKSLQILERRLEEAVRAENFELAAQFRDEIKGLK